MVITGNSMLNGVNGKGRSKSYRRNIKNFPGGASARIFENIDQLAKSEPDCLIVHAERNDLANGTNVLNQAKKKIVKQVKKVSQKDPERP